MNKNKIWIIAAVIAVVILGFWFMSSKPAKEAEETTSETPVATNNQQSNETSTASQSTPGSLGSLMKQGGNYTCNVTTIADTGKAQGTIYGSNGKIRFDFQIQSPQGLTITTHTIRDNGVAYSWVDGSTKGTKTAISTASAVAPGPMGGSIQVSDDSQVASDCHPWIPDASQFVPPKGITF
jgi:hypothetical protein